jgi:hypothetical protein
MVAGEVSESALNVLACSVIAKFAKAERIRCVDILRAMKNDIALDAAVRNLWPSGTLPDDQRSPGRRISYSLMQVAGRDFGGRMLTYTPAGDQAYSIFRVMPYVDPATIEAKPVQLELNGHVDPPTRRIVQNDGRDDEFKTLRREMAEMRTEIGKRFVDVLVAVGKTSKDVADLIAALGGAR